MNMFAVALMLGMAFTNSVHAESQCDNVVRTATQRASMAESLCVSETGSPVSGNSVLNHNCFHELMDFAAKHFELSATAFGIAFCQNANSYYSGTGLLSAEKKVNKRGEKYGCYLDALKWVSKDKSVASAEQAIAERTVGKCDTALSTPAKVIQCIERELHLDSSSTAYDAGSNTNGAR